MKLSVRIILGFLLAAIIPLALMVALVLMYVNSNAESVYIDRSDVAVKSFRHFYDERINRLEQSAAALANEKQFLINLLDLPRREAQLKKQLEEAVATGEFDFAMVKLHDPPALLKSYQEGMGHTLEQVHYESLPEFGNNSSSGVLRLNPQSVSALAAVSVSPVFHRSQEKAEVIAGIMLSDLIADYPLELSNLSALAVRVGDRALFVNSEDSLLISSLSRLSQVRTDKTYWQATILNHSYFVREMDIIGIDGKSVGSLMYIFDQHELIATKHELLKTIVLLGAAAILLSLLLGFVYQRSLSRPVKEMAQAARKLAAGQQTGRALYVREDEIGDIVTGLNQLADNLEETREKLRRSEQVAAWQMFARQTAHEIRNYLMPLVTTTSQMQRWLDNDDLSSDKLRQALESIQYEAGRMRQLTGAFSEFAKLPAPKLRSVNLDQLLDRIRAAFSERLSRAELVINSEGEIPALNCDPDLLLQVLVNLIRNSFEAEASIVELKVSAGPTRTTFEVADDGGGVPTDKVDRIFTPLFTTKSQGSGLGLAICRRIVLDHGGDLTFRNNLTRGAVFTFYLPRDEEA